MTHRLIHVGLGLFCIVCLSATSSLAQETEHQALLEGTQAYEAGKYGEAVDYFGAAIDRNDASANGHYNLGNALYKSERYEEAASQFQQAEEQAVAPKDKARALYNLGNSRLAQAQNAQQGTQSNSGDHLKAAIDAYKQALRHHPQDFDAKNNLATAYRLLRQQQPPQQKNQNDQQQNKEQNQDNQQSQNDQQQNQRQKQNQQNQEQQNQQQQNPAQPEQKQPKKEQQPSGEPREITKAEAKRILEMVEQGDKRVQRRLLEQRRSVPRKIEKKW